MLSRGSTTTIGDCRSSVPEMTDDWASIKDRTERRKAQNRVHQRARRRRKAAQEILNLGGQQHAETCDHVSLSESPMSASTGPFGVLIPVKPTRSLEVLREHSQLLALGQKSSALTTRRIARRLSDDLEDPPSCRRQQLIPPLVPYIRDTRDFSKVRSVDFLSISPDHRLITLVQYNVLRAVVINMSILSLYDMMPDECGAAYSLFCLPPPPQAVPPSLSPTLLQQTTPHPVWIGTAPDPVMRDNLIKNFERFDPDDLCCDMLGGLYEGFNDVERRGMIVWSDPWSPDGWEVTEGFAKKWGYLLKGCGHLLASTNRWRALRGEDPLIIEV